MYNVNYIRLPDSAIIQPNMLSAQLRSACACTHAFMSSRPPLRSQPWDNPTREHLSPCTCYCYLRTVTWENPLRIIVVNSLCRWCVVAMPSDIYRWYENDITMRMFAVYIVCCTQGINSEYQRGWNNPVTVDWSPMGSLQETGEIVELNATIEGG